MKVYDYNESPKYSIGDIVEAKEIVKVSITSYKGHRILTYTCKTEQSKFCSFGFIEKECN